MKGTTEGGEIVQVQGGHILRSTGRKDRHSKVYTSKGPRDRRVRLSAHTAIQFYDVQDRLGYDRPSKAVDWLIKKAKTAIDKLNELPPWQPNDSNHTPTTDSSNPSSNELALNQQSETPSGYALIQPNNPSCSNSSFMAPPEEHDAHLVNTIKSFFPTSSLTNDAVPRTSFQAQELGLSLHTFQADNQGNANHTVLPFQESFQRIDGWNSGGDMDGRVGFLMNPLEISQQALFSQGLSFSHRELLQSNLAVPLWNQRPLASTGQQNPQPRGRQSSDFGSPFELGFRVPARIYGEDEPDTHR
ncbi:hypothetical protein Pfo_013824 [Paulownia fortunei]|nr:hypothetical protein Pfo_013824 [Paulownia fortunei]